MQIFSKIKSNSYSEYVSPRKFEEMGFVKIGVTDKGLDMYTHPDLPDFEFMEGEREGLYISYLKRKGAMDYAGSLKAALNILRNVIPKSSKLQRFI